MAIRRRDFLKSAGTASVSAGLFGSAAVAAAAANSNTGGAFSFADDRVPMNAANLCPMPAAISRAVARFAAELDVDMSGPNRKRLEAYKDTARAGLASELGVTEDEIAIVRNTSEANNIVVQGIALEAGDDVLLWDQNHPSNSVSWAVRAERSGCNLRRISVPVSAGSIDEVVDAFLAALTPKTRVVSFTHISNVTGFRLPAKEICSAIHAANRNIHVHVDGAQSWGAVAVNLSDMGADSFSGSAHKWYMGPREVGLLVVRTDKQDNIWPGVVSIPWGSAAEPSVAGARRFEALGQRDDAAIAALAETVRFHAELGPDVVEQRSMAVADELRDALADIDAPFVSPSNPLFTSSVVILAAPSKNRSALISNVLRDAGVILAGVNGLRLSPHIYNNSEHVARVVKAIHTSRGLLG